MYLIGLTGGIASGKSSISRHIANSGISVFDADGCAHHLTEKGGAGIDAIAEVFGSEYIIDGVLNRKKMSQLVFNDKIARKKLEDILVTMIWQRAEKFIADRQLEKVIVIDAPLLIEKGWHQKMDEVWLVKISEEEQIRRVMIRDGMDEKAARARLENQMRTQEKQKYADVIIDNSGTLEQALVIVDVELARVLNK